jgi:hypothetical protein
MKAVSQRIGPMMLTLVFAAVIFIPQPGIGQLLQGTLNRYVTDPNQAAVVGAAVTVTNEGTIPIMRTRPAASAVALLWKPSA